MLKLFLVLPLPSTNLLGCGNLDVNGKYKTIILLHITNEFG